MLAKLVGEVVSPSSSSSSRLLQTRPATDSVWLCHNLVRGRADAEGEHAVVQGSGGGSRGIPVPDSLQCSPLFVNERDPLPSPQPGPARTLVRSSIDNAVNGSGAWSSTLPPASCRPAWVTAGSWPICHPQQAHLLVEALAQPDVRRLRLCPLESSATSASLLDPSVHCQAALRDHGADDPVLREPPGYWQYHGAPAFRLRGQIRQPYSTLQLFAPDMMRLREVRSDV
ncbi:hypothetical protein Micbo1qcDRAFT_181012 [Microdochium bolleyi]|uniref:Uncharacterized protein n=1 Tax=Microdochium bolleyi TaxID=196109 RepID=A0A136IKR9_9PEZI|nr:hypothetical protein Micbo1qcDRAFT_181012 [Microdochium bolleyi]